jgi:hypothetical protein
MKVYIGDYKDWVGPHQIANLLRYVGVSEDKCDDIGKWLDENTPITKICQFIDNKRKRKVKVKIHDYDVWNMDNTLAYIILPMLKKIREEKQGSPYVDLEDVPENLRDESKDEFEIDKKHHDRWFWVLDEMIWTFDQIHPDNDWESQYYTDKPESERTTKYDIFNIDSEGYSKHQERITNGLRLFGKYYQGLWT